MRGESLPREAWGGILQTRHDITEDKTLPISIRHAVSSTVLKSAGRMISSSSTSSE